MSILLDIHTNRKKRKMMIVNTIYHYTLRFPVKKKQ